MQKTTRRRDDFLHKESIRYARQYGTVVVERLAIQNMTRSAKGTAEEPGTNVRAKAGLNRSILAQGWGRFVQYLQYKCDERGGVVLDVEPRNTSRTCSSCGTVDAESRDGKDFNCTSCGHSEDADVNAARVVLALGLRGEVAAPKKPKKKLHSVVGKRRKAKEPTTADAGAGQDPERPVEDQRDSAPEKQESSGTSTQKPRRKRPSKTRAEAAE
jgi:putative transposase